MTARNIGLIAFFTIAPTVVFGEETGPQPAPAPQPSPAAENHLTMERIQNGFVIAPDNRFTDVDGRFANLLGFYGGWMMDRTFLIGAGGYWLTNGSHDQEMSYGGAVFEWLIHGDRRLGFSTRALIGGGSASLPGTTISQIPFPMPYPFPMGGVPQPGHGSDHDGFWGPWDPERGWPPNGTGHLHDGFFVAEPQLNVSWKMKRWLHVTAGGGYRFISGTRSMNSRLDGASGSVSVQIGGGS